MNKDHARLLHMQDAMENIEHYAERGERSQLVEDAIVRQLQIIGEAARKMSPQFRSSHPEIPWKKIIGLRVIIVHEYMKVESSQIWRTVEDELPTLKAQVQQAIKLPWLEGT